MKEVENVLRILEETKEALKDKNSAKIKSLSNQTTNTASLTQDGDNIAVAVIVYALSKIIEREDYQQLPGWKKFYEITMLSLEHSIKDLKDKNEISFRKNFASIRNAISKLSGKLKIYIQEVIKNAQVNKASRIHEHGISVEQTAQLLGVNRYELAEYIGRTGISEVPGTKTMTAKKRVKLAEEIFG